VILRFHWCLIILMAACSGARARSGAHASQVPAVDSAADRLLSALRSNSSDSLLALMGDDVVLMPPDAPVLEGKEAVRLWYDQFLTQLRTSNLTISDREVFVGGEWATEVAGFEWRLVPIAGGPPMVDRGHYIQVWHRQTDGRWLFAREVWNSSLPRLTAH